MLPVGQSVEVQCHALIVHPGHILNVLPASDDSHPEQRFLGFGVVLMTCCFHTLSDGLSQHALLLDLSQILISLLTRLLRTRRNQNASHSAHITETQTVAHKKTIRLKSYLILPVCLQQQSSRSHGSDLEDVLANQRNLLKQLLTG